MIAVKSFNMRQKIILKLMGDGKFKVIVIKKRYAGITNKILVVIHNDNSRIWYFELLRVEIIIIGP